MLPKLCQHPKHTSQLTLFYLNFSNFPFKICMTIEFETHKNTPQLLKCFSFNFMSNFITMKVFNLVFVGAQQNFRYQQSNKNYYSAVTGFNILKCWKIVHSDFHIIFMINLDTRVSEYFDGNFFSSRWLKSKNGLNNKIL